MAKTKDRRTPTYIKQWRRHRGLTQEQLAEATELSAATISLLERNLVNYTGANLERIARALDCEPADLLAHNPNDTESIWPLWRSADARERRQLVEIAKLILKTRPSD